MIFLNFFRPLGKSSKHLLIYKRTIKEEIMSKKTKSLNLNFGPQHPAAHGVLRMVLQLDGEVNIYYFVYFVVHHY